MTVAGYYYSVVSLIIIVLGAAAISRISRADPRAWRLITNIAAALFLVMLVVWMVLMHLGAAE